MIIKVIAVGRLREKYWQDGVAEYSRRLKPYARLELVEIPEARVPENASPAEEAKAMAEEAGMIQDRLPERGESLVIALDRQGKALDSLELAGLVERQVLDGRKEVDWIIGGPLGLGTQITKRADLVVSFSRLTFPHQMMRLILLEQIYRIFRIMHRQPYHK